MTMFRALSGDHRRLTTALVFALHGATIGTYLSRIAELRVAMNLDEAQFGIALVGGPLGVLVGSFVASGVIERFGIRRTLLVAYPAFAGGLVLEGLAVDAATFFAALAFFGFALTHCNIAMNVEADRVEAATGRRMLNRGHGSWGIGFLVASLAGTGAVAAGMRPLIHFVVAFFAISVATVLIVWPLVASPPRAHSGGARSVRRLALPTAGVLLIMAFALSGYMMEDSSRNWSVIYLRDNFHPDAWVATLTLPAFIVTLTIGRFVADPLIDWHGPVRVAIALVVVSAVGLALVSTAHTVAMALVGFALIGLGVSTAQPQALSAVARLGDRPSSLNVASFATLQTVLSFLAPPLFGFVASHYGVRISFAMLLPLPLLALAFARFLEPPQPSAPASPA